jgi:dTDP-4-dehydrorhamnose reductase
MAKLTRDKPALKVVDDQRGRPTSAEHLAATALALLDRGARGTFHVTDGGECSWYEFTLEIAKLLGRTCTIDPCTTAEFPRPAPRPAYSVLDLSKTEELLGPMPDWRKNLADVIARLEAT